MDTEDQLMISDGEGSKSLDLMRIVQEGDKVNTTVVESDCPGVMEETAEYEFITMDAGIEESHGIKITRVLDSVTEQKVFNAEEPWVVGVVQIRYGNDNQQMFANLHFSQALPQLFWPRRPIPN